jgi:hypothetical protein
MEMALGYDLHVTRKTSWADDDGPSISLEEWLEYAAKDPDLRQDEENPGSENWKILLPEGSWPLWWDARGELVTKNPDPAAVAKLVRIASALGARVLGDDDESYT